MNLFKELWNGVWHYETPQDETIRWIVESGLGELICMGIIVIPVTTGFVVYLLVLNRIHWTKPRQKFEIRHAIAVQTGNKSVYDMSDEELLAFQQDDDF
jgi:hypothetical protein